MPSIPKLQQMIDESEPGDWPKQVGPIGTVETDDPYHQQVWVYEHDVNLRIERGQTVNKDFREEWNETFPSHENDQSEAYWVFYGATPVERQTIVAVDGYRAYIPLPDRPDSEEDTWAISSYQDSFGEIVNQDYRAYRDHLDRAGITIEQ